MSMSFGGGDQYAPLMEALMRRQQAMQQQRQQQPQMPQQAFMAGPSGGATPQMPQGYSGTSGAASMAAGMPSASSMADMLKRMQGNGQGPSLYERFQGWGSDLGSRMPAQPGGEIQTYQVGQTPIGGGY